MESAIDVDQKKSAGVDRSLHFSSRPYAFCKENWAEMQV